MSGSGLEDRIGTGWEGEQYLLGATQHPEWLIVLLLAHPSFPGERAVKRVCCCLLLFLFLLYTY